MPDITTNHELQLWAAGETDWEHRADMQALDTAVEIRDFESNLNNYSAKSDAKFIATDTNAVYLGDGTNWNAITFKPTADHIADTTNPHSVTAAQANALPDSGGTVTGDINLNGANRLTNIGAETEGVWWQLDTAATARDWGKLQFDDASGTNVYWTSNRASADAFRVRNSTASTNLFNINDGGLVEVQAGDLSVSGGTSVDQRGAPTTSELADGKRMQYVSDGTDAHSAGDLVSARNNAGTIVSQVIAAAADDA